MSTPDPIRRFGIVRRVDALFRAMSTDFLLREQFVTGPAQVIAEYVQGGSLPEHEAAASNQLIYSVMANRGLLIWLRRYAMRHHGSPPSRGRFLRDFSLAVAEHGGHRVIIALLRGVVDKESVISRGNLDAIIESAIEVFGPNPDRRVIATFGVLTAKTAVTSPGTFTDVKDPETTATGTGATVRTGIRTEGTTAITHPGTTFTDVRDPDTTGTGTITGFTGRTEITHPGTTFTDVRDPERTGRTITGFTGRTEITHPGTTFTDVRDPERTGGTITGFTARTEITQPGTTFTDVRDPTTALKDPLKDPFKTDQTSITMVTKLKDPFKGGTALSDPIKDPFTTGTASTTVTGLKDPWGGTRTDTWTTKGMDPFQAGATGAAVQPGAVGLDEATAFSRENYVLVSLLSLAEHARRLEGAGLLDRVEEQ